MFRFFFQYEQKHKGQSGVNKGTLKKSHELRSNTWGRCYISIHFKLRSFYCWEQRDKQGDNVIWRNRARGHHTLDRTAQLLSHWTPIQLFTASLGGTFSSAKVLHLAVYWLLLSDSSTFRARSRSRPIELKFDTFSNFERWCFTLSSVGAQMGRGSAQTGPRYWPIWCDTAARMELPVHGPMSQSGPSSAHGLGLYEKHQSTSLSAGRFVA